MIETFSWKKMAWLTTVMEASSGSYSCTKGSDERAECFVLLTVRAVFSCDACIKDDCLFFPQLPEETMLNRTLSFANNT